MPRFFTVKVKGQTIVFSSELSDQQAMDALSEIPQKSTFAQGLLKRNRLSACQLAWVHKLVLDAREADRPSLVPDADTSKVIEMFDNASKKLKSPKIMFMMFSLERDDKGGVIVKSGKSTRGWMNRDGSLVVVPGVEEMLLNELKTMLKDPLEYVCKYGMASGRCCFCGHLLKEEKSLGVGYGPSCAKSYKLPWGKKKTNVGGLVA